MDFILKKPTEDNIGKLIEFNEATPEKQEEMKKDSNNEQKLLEFMYHEIIGVLKDYLVMEENQYKIIALWIIGTYMHESFNTYPLLFFNAMRGSGKTRTLRLISALGAGGDGSVQNNLTEAVLFRIPRGKTTCIDEVEQIGNKEKATLRELLNAAYKKGMKVCRMKKSHKKDPETGKLEEVHIAEEFEPYFPIALANINGLDEVLADRAITLILEKSDDQNRTMKIEDYQDNLKIQWIKAFLTKRCSLVQFLNGVVISRTWNLWLNSSKSTLHTLHTLHTYTTLTTPEIEEYKKVTTNTVSVDLETHEFFEKLAGSNIVGRNFELFGPLLLLAKGINDMLFDDILEVVKLLVTDKKSTEYESKDVSLYEFVLNQENHVSGEFISVKDLTRTFREFTNDTENEDRWLNDKWMGRALKRLNLVLDKRRMKFGMEVRLNYGKAKEKLKIFI